MLMSDTRLAISCIASGFINSEAETKPEPLQDWPAGAAGAAA